jgi:ferric-dicitrate binding protein FerR (iron transport regulator)
MPNALQPGHQIGRSHLPFLIVLGTILAAGAAAWLLWPEPKPVPRIVKLTDGTESFHYSDSDLTPAAGYPQPREIVADGEFFLKAAAHAEPLIVRTRLLVLTITGETAIRIVAHHHEAGEQVEVLYGHVVARKSYPSNYSEPDTLEAGGMVLINKDIDLMEKEKCDLDELRAWSEQWMAAIRSGQAAPTPNP